jgi:preprotein translocase subunit SecG
METLIQIVHVLVAFFMIFVVLIQGGSQGGIGAAFGGGNSSGVFGATGATSILGKMTYGAAFIFMATSISLTVIQGKGGDIGLRDKLKTETTTPVEATTTAPAATTTVPATTAAPAAVAPEAAVAPATTPEAAAPAAVAPETKPAQEGTGN